ncbi:hypothetical protein KXD93_21805 [Mucilaginibacter sp. BJC16-A38]|uniref:hypothetical protein n=1 Tax=Mucilaginibacter phenanthrenivorans TaxID=1234842 RepID=UPI002156FF9D|nr:hypothetical protein [Mucilaginibacter phenanthrenivorans]MCR8560303.1 hypothetical protein [Mucilaginibacter phenanthrenivorans]
METLKMITALISFITACMGISIKLKTSNSKHMNKETIPYLVLIIAFLLLVGAICYLAKINLRK